MQVKESYFSKVPYRTQMIAVIAGMAALAAVGIVASFLFADRIRETEYAAWLAEAKTETYQMSERLHAKLYRTESTLRAIAERFRAAGSINPAEFRTLVEESRDWDPEVRFDVVAFAERVAHAEREAFEQSAGQTLTSVGNPDEAAPITGESFAVRVAAPPNELIRPFADLATHAALLETVKTARRLPGTAVLGISFVGENGQRKIPVAITADLGAVSGVIVATFDLKNFVAETVGVDMAPGLGMRLVERDSEAGATPQQTAILGEMTAPGEAISHVVRLSKGMARWSLNWDISRTFQGGPHSGIERLARIGGSAASVLLAAALAYLTVLSLRFRQQVREKTAELSRKAMIIQLTMDSIDQGFAVWNSDQRLVVWSRRCQDFWYSPGDWLVPGTHMRQLLKHLAAHGAFGKHWDDDIIERELERIVSAGVDSQERFQMTDGVHVHVRRFPLEHGGHVAVYTDTSTQDKAMEQLAESRDAMEAEVRRRTHDLIVARDRAEKANLAKTHLLANVSHELRTPLNAIIGFAEMIDLNIGIAGTNAKTHGYARHIMTAGQSLLSVVSDLLDVSRIEAGVLEIESTEVDVPYVLNDVIELIQAAADKRDVEIISDTDKNLPSLYVDEHRFRQILINLTDNAVKFSNPGGVVTVSAGIDPRGNMAIRVSDKGIGISEHDIPRILEPFQQVENVLVRTHEGAGLGLPLARSLTELMNGRFEVMSTVGEGTTVTLVFPRDRVGRKAGT